MRPRRALVLAAVTALGIVAVVSLTGATAVALDEGAEAESAENASLGMQTGSFMQSSSAGAESAVSEGMFDVEYDRADDREAALAERAAGLDARLTALEQQKESLEERDEDDVSTEIRMSRVASQIHSIDREVNNSAERATQAGHSGTAFDDLSGDIADLRGPDVAAAADATPGGPAPEDVGPPDDAPPRNDTPAEDDEQGSDDQQNDESTETGQSDREAPPADP
ncbi:hypothetical protein [Natranaeroarchaeum sulfidigenes]|uniref:Putative component of type IV pili like system n=1 Tax=Natranaeroarchaeum sulfidigenes TaxID=2784880 RepID=A0A897MY75_9EURY|nr:hypothetical protein [Natranaeroarchaeum sulfidigenes]QSG03295.1 putative component of type IV pili like system [Natranaeroarchaeum sulfidigenes]